MAIKATALVLSFFPDLSYKLKPTFVKVNTSKEDVILSHWHFYKDRNDHPQISSL